MCRTTYYVFRGVHLPELSGPSIEADLPRHIECLETTLGSTISSLPAPKNKSTEFSMLAVTVLITHIY